MSSSVNNIAFYREEIRKHREYLLANLVMIAEVPAPTFQELRRGELLLDRMVDSDLTVTDCAIDDVGNVIGYLPGSGGRKTILVSAHQDTNFSETDDHTVVVHPSYLTGVGLADNGLGLATLVSLPRLLKAMNIQLSSNIVLLASSQSLGKGNLGGIQNYLDGTDAMPDTAICLEGYPLGRISCLSIGMLRGQIRYHVPDSYDWTRFGASGAIVSINEIINRILEIPCPQRPRTSIVLNRLESIAAYNTIPGDARLQLEIRSDSIDMVKTLQTKIENICAEAAAKSGAEVSFEEIARRHPGNLPVAHPLVADTLKIFGMLEIEARMIPSTSELTAFMVRNIPAITIGLSQAEYYNTHQERLAIEPLFDGVTQLIALLQSIDSQWEDNND